MAAQDVQIDVVSEHPQVRSAKPVGAPQAAGAVKPCLRLDGTGGDSQSGRGWALEHHRHTKGEVRLESKAPDPSCMAPANLAPRESSTGGPTNKLHQHRGTPQLLHWTTISSRHSPNQSDPNFSRPQFPHP